MLLSRASNVSGERSPFEGSCCGSGYHTVDSTPLGSPEEMEVPKYRVVMLGDAGVGKTALVSQFMTSEYMNTYDASLGESLTITMQCLNCFLSLHRRWVRRTTGLCVAGWGGKWNDIYRPPFIRNVRKYICFRNGITFRILIV